jgi:hypothetical protein
MNQSKFEELTNLMASKAVPHYAFELLADLRLSEREEVDRAEKAEAELAFLQQKTQELKIQLASKSLGSDADRILKYGQLINRAEKAEARLAELEEFLDSLEADGDIDFDWKKKCLIHRKESNNNER